MFVKIATDDPYKNPDSEGWMSMDQLVKQVADTVQYREHNERIERVRREARITQRFCDLVGRRMDQIAKEDLEAVHAIVEEELATGGR